MDKEANKTKLLDYTPRPAELEPVGTANFDEVADMFKEEKGGKTIEKELEEFSSASSSEKEVINDKIEEKSEFSLDDLGEGEEEEENEGEEEEENEGEEAGEIEDYFESAEFIIFIIELAIVWGTNFYLKSRKLDKIGEEEFKKTARQQKSLVRSWAKVLQKHNAKISPEVELLFNMGASYGMKIQGIVKRQEERKRIEIENLKKGGKTTVKKPKKKRETPTFNPTDSVTVEAEDIKPKKKSKKGFSLDTDKEIVQENDPMQLA